MAALLGSRRGLFALAVLASSCSVYGPELVGGAPPQGGSAGDGGAQANGGGSAAAGKQSAGSAGDEPSGGTGGSAGKGGSAGSGGGDVAPPMPYLRAENDPWPLTVVLSSEGTNDWKHWGLKGPADSNRKAGVTSQLDLEPYGSAGSVTSMAGPTAFSWNDGTPTLAATTHTGVAWEGAGQGFELTVPAVVEERIARVYVGVIAGTAHLTAQLSEADTFVYDDLIESDGDTWERQMVTFEYGSVDTPNATLTITLNVETAASADAAVNLSAISIDVK